MLHRNSRQTQSMVQGPLRTVDSRHGRQLHGRGGAGPRATARNSDELCEVYQHIWQVGDSGSLSCAIARLPSRLHGEAEALPHGAMRGPGRTVSLVHDLCPVSGSFGALALEVLLLRDCFACAGRGVPDDRRRQVENCEQGWPRLYHKLGCWGCKPGPTRDCRLHCWCRYLQDFHVHAGRWRDCWLPAQRIPHPQTLHHGVPLDSGISVADFLQRLPAQ
mmetsp:Transcript_100715/g.323399  ORF Transcript_100715/g.323399 Transcript_100715/m.323399 type:complete len:219 (-) Transcript_100715:1296-1952(-)